MTADKDCGGVDLNRNFDFAFNSPIADKDVCDISYQGPFALSEPESKALPWFLEKNKDVVTVYFTIHCFAEVILYPFAL